MLLVILLLVVAAASGAVDSGHAGGAVGLGTPVWVGDIVVAGIAGVLTFMVYELVALFQFGARSGGRARGPLPTAAGAIVTAVVVVALVLLFRWLLKVRHTPKSLTSASQGPHINPQALANARTSGDIGLAPVLIGVLVGVVAIAIVTRGFHLGRRLSPTALPPPGLGACAGERLYAIRAVALSLEALQAEPDPRRAIVAAYLCMEAWLGNVGLGRHLWEAPFEHLDRVTVHLGATTSVGTTLAGLYERARFGQHRCGPGMKTEAIEALLRLRADLEGVPGPGPVFAGAGPS